MAGILRVDTLESDSNLALKIATANVAFIDSNGLNVVGGNLTIGATQFAEGGQIQTAGIADDAVTSDKILSVANTKISGLIQAAQIGSANASVIDAGTLAGARLPAGSVLQVVQGLFTSTTTTTSNTAVATGLTASITPTSASSKILVLVFGSQQQVTSGTTNIYPLFRDGTSILNTFMIYSNPTPDGVAMSAGYLDSPATTSSTTYALYFYTENRLANQELLK